MTKQELFPIQLVIGPRQSGKTTQILQLIREDVLGRRHNGKSREVAVFCRNASLIEERQKQIPDVADVIRWEIYTGEGEPGDLIFAECETSCYFLDTLFTDFLVTNILSSPTTSAGPNPCVVELSIDHKKVKFVI